MDPNTAMFLAALMLASEQAPIPDGAVPSFALGEDGSVTVTVGETVSTFDAEALAEEAAALMDMGEDEPEDSADMAGEEPVA